MSIPITVHKQNHLGQPVFSWKGELLAASPSCRLVSAFFNGADEVSVDQVVFRKGDLMLERYFTDRWYNVFEVRQGDSEVVKCWYINLSSPALFNADSIIWQDLALDLIVYPNGAYRLLDEEEYNALNLRADQNDRCQAAVRELVSQPELIKPGLTLRPDL